MEPPVYVVVGHGNEEPVPYNERPRVPPDYTVVLLAKPGRPFSGINAGALWSNMQQNPDLYADPIGNREEIKRIAQQDGLENLDVRIYKAGMPVPDMRINPQSYFLEPPNYLGGLPATHSYLISGIYKLPLPFRDIRANALVSNSYSSVSRIDIERFYSGDANQRLREILRERFGERPNLSLLMYKDEFTFTLNEILAMNSPGVYYFFNCRYVRGMRARIEEFKKSVKRFASEYQKEFKSYELNEKIQSFMRAFEEIQQRNLPQEDKLPFLRTLILEDTLLEGDGSIGEEEPYSDSYVEERREESYTYAFASLKRNILRMFDGEFGSLLAHLPATRQRSAAGQAAYSGTGGKRKTRRGKKRGTRRKTKRV